jgi:AIG2 family protein
MKNQYFADERDLFKYDLLLELMQSMPSLTRLVLIPMLTADDGRRDGNRVSYDAGGFRAEVHAFLQDRLRAGERDLTKLRSFFANRPFEYVPHLDDTLFSGDRDEYFARIHDDKLQNALVFFDPDNGLEPAGGFTRAHLRYGELAGVLARAGPKSVGVVIQFLPRRDRVVFFEEATRAMRKLLPDAGLLGVERGALAFLIVVRNAHIPAILRWMPGYLEQRQLRPLPRLATTVEPFQMDRPHFGYGSNMCDTWLERDARSARAVGSAYLAGRALTFDKESTRDHSAKANVVASAGGRVWGVLFNIEPIDLPQLNTKEGGYRPIAVDVALDNGTSTRAWTLVASESQTDLRPWDWYVRLIIAGARHHTLPYDYVRALEATPTQGAGDPADVERADRSIEQLFARTNAGGG